MTSYSNLMLWVAIFLLISIILHCVRYRSWMFQVDRDCRFSLFNFWLALISLLGFPLMWKRYQTKAMDLVSDIQKSRHREVAGNNDRLAVGKVSILHTLSYRIFQIWSFLKSSLTSMSMRSDVRNAFEQSSIMLSFL